MHRQQLACALLEQLETGCARGRVILFPSWVRLAASPNVASIHLRLLFSSRQTRRASTPRSCGQRRLSPPLRLLHLGPILRPAFRHAKMRAGYRSGCVRMRCGLALRAPPVVRVVPTQQTTCMSTPVNPLAWLHALTRNLVQSLVSGCINLKLADVYVLRIAMLLLLQFASIPVRFTSEISQ